MVGGLALGAAVAAELLLVFLPRYFVTVDGPFHLGVAALLRDILQGHGALALHYYGWHVFPVPNLLPDLALTGLMLVFDPALSEKLLIAGYIVGLPLALLYAIRAVSPQIWLAFVALPLTFSFAFNYGFYNFSYSTILFLVVAGYALRHRRELTGRQALTLAGLLVVTYFTHIVGFLEALLFVFLVLAFDLSTAGSGEAEERAAIQRRRIVALALLAPSALLAAWFFLGTKSDVPAGYAIQPRVRLEFFALTLGVTSYSRFEALWMLLVAAMIAVLVVTVVRLRERPLLRPRASDAPLVFTLIGSVAVVFAPFQVVSGGSFIYQRLALFPIYGIILWIAAYRVPRRLLISAAAISLVAATGLALTRLPTYRKLDSIVTDFMAVKPCLAPGSTMIQASMALALPASDVRLDPVTDETGRLAADLRGLDLGSIEGSVPFYVLQFRPPLDPQTHLVLPGQYIEGIPPPLDPLGYQRRTGGRVDYVLLFGLSHASASALRSPAWAAFRRELGSGFRLVAVSPRGWVQAWERRGSSAAVEGRKRRLASADPVCHPRPASSATARVP